ncbi:hypothetical protein [Cohnella faecalis]|uniref:hypothetical protein n=1 Tax=Cohnella faecalis TaxID=2315694 RepID=UPI001314720B|nr:hypothetical protein [Cohnella faecalis]
MEAEGKKLNLYKSMTGPRHKQLRRCRAISQAALPLPFLFVLKLLIAKEPIILMVAGLPNFVIRRFNK